MPPQLFPLVCMSVMVIFWQLDIANPNPEVLPVARTLVRMLSSTTFRLMQVRDMSLTSRSSMTMFVHPDPA